MSPEGAGQRKIIEKVETNGLHGVNLGAILKRNRKGERDFRGTFDLLHVTGRGHHRYTDLGEPQHISTLYMYGEEGLVINATRNNGDCAVVCAVSYDLSPIQASNTFNNVQDADPRKYPRIMQMLGCTRPAGDERTRRSVTMEALSTFSLEDVLLDLVVARAKQINLPAIGMIPAHASPQRFIEGYRMDKAEQRFDGTARKHGFTKNPSGLYVLELDAVR